MFNNFDIFSYYKKYWDDSNSIQIMEKLLKTIQNYNFNDFDYFIKKATDERLKLGDLDTKFNNFFSGTYQKYEFGPNANFWVNKIENILRTSNTNTNKIDLFIRTDLNNDEIKKIPTGFYVIKKYLNSDFLINFIEKNYNYSPFNIICNSLVINELFNENNFIDYLRYNSKVFGITNLDTPLYKEYVLKGVHLNDQMIDWKCGLNFYTCTKGQKHFLPLFGITENNEIVSLLNLRKTYSLADDYFKIKSIPIRCQCGKIRIGFDFISHQKNYPKKFDTSVVNRLIGKYKYFQFVETGNEINFYYDIAEGDLPQSDKELLDKWNVIYHYSQIYKIGRKMPPFWREN